MRVRAPTLSAKSRTRRAKPVFLALAAERYAVPVKHGQPRVSVFAAIAGMGVVACLTLVGCANPTSADSSGTAAADGTTSDSPGDVDLDGFHGVPASFPSDVPIVDGDVPMGIDLGTGWSVVVSVDDIAKSYAEASGKLSAAGFEVLQDGTTADGSFGVFENDKYQVQVTASNTIDYGPAVSYVVVLLG